MRIQCYACSPISAADDVTKNQIEENAVYAIRIDARIVGSPNRLKPGSSIEDCPAGQGVAHHQQFG